MNDDQAPKLPSIKISDPLSEMARARQEKWKAVQKAIGLTEKAGGFLARIVGPPADALGDLLGDQMKSWRAANLDRLARKWEKIRHQRGLASDTVRALPFGDAVRAIGAASVEEDDEVLGLWARLLANASDPNSEIKIQKSFVHVLSALTASEAIVLDIFFRSAELPIFPEGKTQKVKVQKFVRYARKRYARLSAEEKGIAFENLVRLRCIGHVFSYPDLIPNYKRDKSPIEQLSTLSAEHLAEIIVNIADEMNSANGWAMDYEGRYKNDVAIINDFSLTTLGFALHRACSTAATEPETPNPK